MFPLTHILELGTNLRSFIPWLHPYIFIYSWLINMYWPLPVGLLCPAKSLQLYPTLCNPVACSPPGSSVCGILQARIVEWVALPSSRGSSWPKGSNQRLLHLLHGQVDSLPLVPSGKPMGYVLSVNYLIQSSTKPCKTEFHKSETWGSKKLYNFSRKRNRNSIFISALCLTNGKEMWLRNNCDSIHQAVSSLLSSRCESLEPSEWVK